MLRWGVVKAGDILVARGSDKKAVLLQNGHVSINDEEMSMQDWLRRVTGWKSVETYKFAIHKESGKISADFQAAPINAEEAALPLRRGSQLPLCGLDGYLFYRLYLNIQRWLRF